MQFQFTEQTLTAAIGTVVAGIAAVFARYLWKTMNNSENGQITLGWAAAILAVAMGTFGGVNWKQTAPILPPEISSADTGEVMKAKMTEYEMKKEQHDLHSKAAPIPYIAAVPMTFMSLPLLAMSVFKLRGGYSDKKVRDQERNELAKLTAVETAKLLAENQAQAETQARNVRQAAEGYATTGIKPLSPQDLYAKISGRRA